MKVIKYAGINLNLIKPYMAITFIRLASLLRIYKVKKIDILIFERWPNTGTKSYYTKRYRIDFIWIKTLINWTCKLTNVN